ncbi:MAG TPA: glycine zipper domain-containing protein [Candidatus Polarisedimenticolia bacterium]|nr:glycine zipper domain-containing protein [Candidatus Polarisedimenticolia bacterium]
MKRTISVAMLASFLLLPALELRAQSEPAAQKTLAATMNVYVFPTKGQDAQQQSQDEAECYSWAVQNTGTDPFELAKKAEADQQKTEQAKKEAEQAGKGAGAQGAVKGAAAGALIGEIASDDAGKGAAYGAAAGVVAGRRRGQKQQEQATQQAEQQGQQAQAANQEQMTNFKKAFSVCLEAKNYMVKY